MSRRSALLSVRNKDRDSAPFLYCRTENRKKCPGRIRNRVREKGPYPNGSGLPATEGLSAPALSYIHPFRCSSRRCHREILRQVSSSGCCIPPLCPGGRQDNPLQPDAAECLSDYSAQRYGYGGCGYRPLWHRTACLECRIHLCIHNQGLQILYYVRRPERYP